MLKLLTVLAGLLPAGVALAGPPLSISIDRVEQVQLDGPSPSAQFAASGPFGVRLDILCDQAPPMPERTFYPMWDTITLTIDANGLDRVLGAGQGLALPSASRRVGDEVGDFLLKEQTGLPLWQQLADGAAYVAKFQTSNNRLTGRVGTEEILSRLSAGSAFAIAWASPTGDVTLSFAADDPVVRSTASALLAACASFHRPG